MILVDAAGLTASRPGKPLFRDVSVTVSSGDRLALVGLNGTGKSTLLGVLAGTVTPEAGAVRRGRGARVTFLDQQAELPQGTVREITGGGWETEAILDRLGMADVVDADVATLSGGQAKRVALAQALLAVGEADEADLLVLDEPTNHLDLDAVEWLEDRLAVFKGGLVLVTHDRHVLDRVTTRILELDAGTGYVHEGGYASYLDARAEREARAATAERVRRNLARAELAWLRRGAPARTRKPKANVRAARAVVDGRAGPPERPEDLPLAELTATPRLGNTVVELDDVADGYGPEPDGGGRGGSDAGRLGGGLLFSDLELALDPRARLGVVGPNGSGKSTLLDIIAGRRTPRHGQVVRGTTVRIGYYDQRGADLPLDTRVREAVAGPTRQPDWTDAALLERFWFQTDAQWAPIRLLSGGERRRLQLVLVLRQAPNVLLLDEPTNDLDLDTLRALEDLLETWPGALVAVSHDRAFLERTVDDVLVLDGNGTATRLPGGYATYEAQRRARSRTAGAGRRRPNPASTPPRPNHTDRPTPRSPSTLRHQLRRADKELTELRDRQTTLERELGEASGDVTTLARVGEQLTEVQAQLARAEEHWLALAEEAESAGLAV